MRKFFDLGFSTTEDECWRNCCMTLPGTKETHELRDAFLFLALWQDDFRKTHGELGGLTHLSGPDDPPDVIVHFPQHDLNIEITTIEASHVLQSNSLHRRRGGGARINVPISRPTSSAAEAEEIMYGSGTGKGWENVTDYLDTRNRIIVERAIEKFANPRFQGLSPGVLLFTGAIEGNEEERSMLKDAFHAVSNMIGAESWTVGFAYRWNPCSFFTAIQNAGGFRFRLSRGDGKLLEG